VEAFFLRYGKIKKCLWEKEDAVLTNSLQLSHKKYEWIWIVIIATLTATSSEIKLLPFEHMDFRFGLGSIIFLLLLLIRPTERVIRTGIVTGLVVVCVRTGLDVGMRNEAVITSLISNAPTAIFYVMYAVGYKVLHMDTHKGHAIILGASAIGIEVVANSSEQLLRLLVSPSHVMIEDWLLIIAVACFRSFFVIGIYFSIAQAYEQRKLTTDLTVHANLYMEALYLQKLMRHVEQVMAESYTLYKKLRTEKHPLHQQALAIAQEIHEVKKDSQRIYAGMTKLTNEMTQTAQLSQLLQHIRQSNDNYAKHLGHNCEITSSQSAELVVREATAILIILNNIVANAVEATQDGVIQLMVTIGDDVVFTIVDEGTGIDVADQPLIFEPGFTTKYDQAGIAATGIGLSHVQEVVKKLEGHIICTSLTTGTCFTITLPKNRIEE